MCICTKFHPPLHGGKFNSGTTIGTTRSTHSPSIHQITESTTLPKGSFSKYHRFLQRKILTVVSSFHKLPSEGRCCSTFSSFKVFIVLHEDLQRELQSLRYCHCRKRLGQRKDQKRTLMMSRLTQK